MWYAIYLFWWPSIKQFMCQLLWSRGYLVAQTSEKWKILACFALCECVCAFAKKIIIILNNFWLARAPYLFAGVERYTFQQRTENGRSIFFTTRFTIKKIWAAKKNREFSRLHFVISNFHSVISRWFEISATESTAVSPFAQLLCIFIALLAFIESSLFKFFFFVHLMQLRSVASFIVSYFIYTWFLLISVAPAPE